MDNTLKDILQALLDASIQIAKQEEQIKKLENDNHILQQAAKSLAVKEKRNGT